MSELRRMFDDVPVRFWLLLLIATAAYLPAQYVYHHIANSPSRRDITRPPEDLSWRTSRQLTLNLSFLAVLVALGFFIFTPAAERFAASPNFWPILILGFGAWALFSVAQGLATGRIQPMLKGSYDTYERETQPKRFWASLIWNTALAFLSVWPAYEMREQSAQSANWDQCFREKNFKAPQTSFSACEVLIAEHSELLRLDPNDYASRYDRGRTYHQIGDIPKAVDDYSLAIRLRPNDPDAYFDRGLIFLESRKFDRAVADFSRAHELAPKDPWPLANRGIAYAWKQDEGRARKDFRAARLLDPSNPVVLRGEALLSMQVADWESAVDLLSESLKRDPDNLWALQMRAWHYQQLGEDSKAQADTRRLLELTKQTVEAQPSPG